MSGAAASVELVVGEPSVTAVAAAAAAADAPLVVVRDTEPGETKTTTTATTKRKATADPSDAGIAPVTAAAAKDDDDDGNGHKNSNCNDHEKRKKEGRQDNRRAVRKANLSWHPGGKELHGGSYADPAQRALFNVTLPDRPAMEGAEPTKKKKVALLIGYLGSAYNGFQINHGQRTLQATLELALYQTGFLSRDNFGYPHKYGWSTSGRTDKGVHAAAQTVSFKMELSSELLLDDVRRALEPLNAALPADVRVLDVCRTTRSFCAKTQRDCVRYQYLIPSFVFAPHLTAVLNATVRYPRNGQPMHTPIAPSELQHLQAAATGVTNYRVTPVQLDTLRHALSQYVGTHSFHNFTRRCTAKEARAKRYIMEFAVHAPVVMVDGVEWIPTTVTGQSFLIHQIRKMISLAVNVTRSSSSGGDDGVGAAVDAVTAALVDPGPLRIDAAPAQGLFLDMSFYEQYNRRKNSLATSMAADGGTTPDLDWFVPGTAAHSRWQHFRDAVIRPHVCAEEAADGNFLQHVYRQDHAVDLRRFRLPGDDGSANDDDESGGEADDG